MRTKICGITNIEDALVAINAGADALGFVFYKKSPRYITIENAKKIIQQLPPFVEKVALFVNVDAKTINTTCQEVGATLAQLHFDADDLLYQNLLIPHVKVIRAKSKEDILKYPNEYKLVDAYCEAYGGEGKRINIEWFEDTDNSKIILAGGLDDTNVAALKQYGFYGVDVSSGVEKAHGKKDIQKVQSFITNASE
ncbi:phosphoribosylanthranilate isomerase [Sulfurimonas sp. SAG-AH-194-I05]|nr:phosphoribosylanthranilate isomerase [Sulfurimonas sp. SAG-AH-194-I05]MDF1874639.1 phosphoribosylanthranilate isomerase [Sulfurimonas sp. SAG-AH-194-I05]